MYKSSNAGPKKHIDWEKICGSRCALDTMQEWLENDISNKELFDTIKGLGHKKAAQRMRSYVVAKNKQGLRKLMKSGMERWE